MNIYSTPTTEFFFFFTIEVFEVVESIELKMCINKNTCFKLSTFLTEAVYITVVHRYVVSRICL
jgi:hypothetical protein